ncbi:hypothetical protein [Streptomyces sp. NPDC002644]
MTAGGAWPRPGAGLEPAATALLSWLADPRAPRLCVVTGGADSGKSLLLAWLASNGTRADAPAERGVHAVVPLQGLGEYAVTWALAEQLLLAARTPAELVAALEADGRRTVLVLPDVHAAQDPARVAGLVAALAEVSCVRVVAEARPGTPASEVLRVRPAAVMDLDDAVWRDAARHAAWLEEQTGPTQQAGPAGRAGQGTAAPSPRTAPPPRTDDPEAVCLADPYAVTSVYEADTDPRGGLRTAWLRAGRALLREQTPAERALTLLCSLGDEADPRLAPALERLAADAPWRLLWRRVRGDALPPWPGPAFALGTGTGAWDAHAVVADHEGVLRLVSLADGSPAGRLAQRVEPQPAAVACLPDGGLWALDTAGRLRGIPREAARQRSSGLDGLRGADRSGPFERAARALERHLPAAHVTALDAVGNLLAVGLEDGTVRALPLQGAEEAEGAGETRETGHAGRAGEAVEGTAVHQEALHSGAVTALALLPLDTAADGGDGGPSPAALLYSGGVDGQVRAWAPGVDVLATPVARRPCPVTALTVVLGPTGPAPVVAWGDGRVDLIEPSSRSDRSLHVGAPVGALAGTPGGAVLVGTDQALLCLAPR